MAALVLDRVTKAFGATTAVANLSLTVPAGSIYGFIGPNGSGKTTSIRMIMNLLVPDEGTITVLGQSSQSAVRDELGYLPEERGLYKRMTVRQVLRYYGQLKGKTVATLDAAISHWLNRLDLSESIDKPVQSLSKGMAQRVQFVSTVITAPKLLILDEPFSGLDPVNADSLRDAVLDLRRAGTTIVLSTHDMHVAERLCDRLFMIFKGVKVLDGTLDEIRTAYGQEIVRVRTTRGAEALSGLAGVEIVTDTGNYQDVRLSVAPQAFLQALAARADVLHFELTTPSLHDIFTSIARPAPQSVSRASA